MTRIRDILTTRGHAFVAAGLTLLVGGLLLGFTDITRVGVLLAALPLLSALNARRGNSSVEVTRTVHPARLVVDQGARVVVVLQNTSDRHTQLLLAEESVHLLLGDRPRFVLPSMVPGDIREVDYPIRSQVRGRFRLGPMTLRRQDPYGLATITTTLPGSIEILVLPRVEVLGNGRPRAGGLGTEGAIPHMVALHGEDDVAVRTYRDGDDLRAGGTAGEGGDGDAAQRHDVGVDALVMHDDEGHQDAQRQRDDGDECRAQVEQEDETHHRDDDEFLQQLEAQVLDGPLDQLGGAVEAVFTPQCSCRSVHAT